MKFFHLSDLHIGLKLHNRDLSEDQEYILMQIVKMAFREKPDAVVIAGDIYDKAVPSAEAVTLFDHFISELRTSIPEAVIMMVSGNHDSAPRVNVFRSILAKQNIHMVGIPPVRVEEHIEKVTLQDSFGNVNFYLLPFVKPSMVLQVVREEGNDEPISYNDAVHKLIEREKIDTAQRNVLVSHQFYLPVGADADKVQRMESEIRTVGNIDEVRADILERFDYAALGHIHKPMKVGSEVYRYCGTPLACSVSEANQQKEIIMVELQQKGEVKTTILPLIPLRQVQVLKGKLEELLKFGSSDYVSIILTDQVDFDVTDMQDRIRNAFPNVLEIRREKLRNADYSCTYGTEGEMNPFELCSSFLKDLDDSEQKLLRDVINTVLEVQE